MKALFRQGFHYLYFAENESKAMEEDKPLPDFYVNATPSPVQEIDQDKYLNLTFRYKGGIYRTKLHPGQEEYYRTLIEQVNKS